MMYPLVIIGMYSNKYGLNVSHGLFLKHFVYNNLGSLFNSAVHFCSFVECVACTQLFMYL